MKTDLFSNVMVCKQLLLRPTRKCDQMVLDLTVIYDLIPVNKPEQLAQPWPI